MYTDIWFFHRHALFLCARNSVVRLACIWWRRHRLPYAHARNCAIARSVFFFAYDWREYTSDVYRGILLLSLPLSHFHFGAGADRVCEKRWNKPPPHMSCTHLKCYAKTKTIDMWTQSKHIYVILHSLTHTYSLLDAFSIVLVHYNFCVQSFKLYLEHLCLPLSLVCVRFYFERIILPDSKKLHKAPKSKRPNEWRFFVVVYCRCWL